MQIKRSDIWHLNETMARELGRIYSLIEATMSNVDKRNERWAMKILKQDNEIAKIKRKVGKKKR